MEKHIVVQTLGSTGSPATVGDHELDPMPAKVLLHLYPSLINWCEELTHLKRHWCWERLKAEGEGDGKGWNGGMASPTWGTWVWASSVSWWWKRKSGMLQSIGSQRVRQDWVTELNWTELINCMGAVQSWQKAHYQLEHRKRGTRISKMYFAVRL